MIKPKYEFTKTLNNSTKLSTQKAIIKNIINIIYMNNFALHQHKFKINN